jgi:hypothetical protein
MIDQNKATRPDQPALGAGVSRETDRLPGSRDGLPAGALGGVPPDPQGDENRDPPANAPTVPA